MSAEYEPRTDNPRYWFLDPITQIITKHSVPVGDLDSCFKQKGMTDEQIFAAVKAKGGKGVIVGIDHIEQYDIIQKKEIPVSRVRMSTAKAVGSYRTETANEGKIRKWYRHSFDKRWYFGMPHNEDGSLFKTRIRQEYYDMLEGHDKTMMEQILQWSFTPIPPLKRMNIDIEVLTHGHVVPDEMLAQEPVISVSVMYSDKPAEVFVLSSNVRKYPKSVTENQMLIEWLRAGRLKVIMCESESELLEHVFQRIVQPGYPLITTFWGTAFDLPYLMNRAKVLKISEHKIPIDGYYDHKQAAKSDRSKKSPWIIKSVGDKLHLDLCIFLDLAVIKNYVFKNKYLDTSLDTVSKALIGIGKADLEGVPISQLPINDLVWYNYWDTYLLEEMMLKDNHVITKIVFLFMRLGRQRFEDAAHRAIGSKIVNLLFGNMIENNILIPTTKELRVFGDIESESVTGKTFEGAKILTPLEGVHFGVDTMDFSSLYPSEMCNRNISFETMNCGHERCKNDPNAQIPFLSHYTCQIYKGIMPRLIGLVKDIRVKIFKPLSKTDPEASAVEQALKVYINASFGVTGYKSFDLYCPPAGESTAASGRFSLDQLREKVATYPGVELVFGDTDSVGLKNAEKIVLRELEHWSDEVLNIELAHEYHAIMFIIGESVVQRDTKKVIKKNYAYVDDEYKVVVKGLAGKKRSTPGIIARCFKETLDEVAEFIKSIPDFEEKAKVNPEQAKFAIRMIIIQKVRDYYMKIWNREGEIDDYAYRTTMRMPISTYKSNPRHVKAAKALAKWLKETSGAAYRHLPDDSLVPMRTQISYVAKYPSGKAMKKIKDRADPKLKTDPIPTQMATKEDICAEAYHGTLLKVMGQIMKPFGITNDEVIILMVDPLDADQTVLAQF